MIDEHSPVHYLIPYYLVCWALACSKQRLSYVLPKLLLCINDGPVIVTGMNSVGTQHVTYLTHFPIPYLYAKKKKKNSSKWTESKDDRWIYDSELSCHWVKYIYISQSLKVFVSQHPFPFHGMKSRLLLTNYA